MVLLCRMTMKMYLPTATIALAMAIAAPAHAQTTGTKIDEALTESLKAGCTTEHVIIRLRPGYRAGMKQSLRSHGDSVTAEHPSIEAVSAEVHCKDLATMEGFSSVLSISQDAIVRPDGLPSTTKKKSAAAAAQQALRDAASREREGESAGSAQAHDLRDARRARRAAALARARNERRDAGRRHHEIDPRRIDR